MVNKLLVVDDQIEFAGGMNIGNDWSEAVWIGVNVHIFHNNEE